MYSKIILDKLQSLEAEVSDLQLTIHLEATEEENSSDQQYILDFLHEELSEIKQRLNELRNQPLLYVRLRDKSGRGYLSMLPLKAYQDMPEERYDYGLNYDEDTFETWVKDPLREDGDIFENASVKFEIIQIW